MPDAADYYDIGDDCRSWAWPWKRNGIGIWENAASASISDGYLKTIFSQGYGQFQGTKLKLTDWFPSGPNGTYTVPRYCRGATTVTQPCWQNSMWLPTSEARAVRTGTIEASVDYTDRGAKNFRLASTSACKNRATDGSDPGANQDMVGWATEGSESGADNPYLDFRVRSLRPTLDGVALRFTAYSTAACTWTISSTRAFTDWLGSVSQSRTGRDGTATITGLSSNTAYWYRVACDGGRYREGEFTPA